MRIPNNNPELNFLPTRSGSPDSALYRQLHYEYRQSRPMKVHLGICIFFSSGMPLSVTTGMLADGGKRRTNAAPSQVGTSEADRYSFFCFLLFHVSAIKKVEPVCIRGSEEWLRVHHHSNSKLHGDY